MKRFVGFAGRVAVAHVLTYIAVGALAYTLLTREFFEGSAGLAAQVMRTPAEPPCSPVMPDVRCTAREEDLTRSTA